LAALFIDTWILVRRYARGAQVGTKRTVTTCNSSEPQF
jgi:hypothetical protein